MYNLPNENDSFLVVKSSLEALMAKTNVELTWFELSKHKGAFVTKNA